MEKKWYKSKTIWGGAALILLGIGGYLNGDLSAIQAIGVDILGWMGIGYRAAMK